MVNQLLSCTFHTSRCLGFPLSAFRICCVSCGTTGNDQLLGCDSADYLRLSDADVGQRWYVCETIVNDAHCRRILQHVQVSRLSMSLCTAVQTLAAAVLLRLMRQSWATPSSCPTIPPVPKRTPATAVR